MLIQFFHKIFSATITEFRMKKKLHEKKILFQRNNNEELTQEAIQYQKAVLDILDISNFPYFYDKMNLLMFLELFKHLCIVTKLVFVTGFGRHHSPSILVEAVLAELLP